MTTITAIRTRFATEMSKIDRQMLMWHIVLIPIVLIAIIGAHVLLVRVRGIGGEMERIDGDGRIRAGFG